MKSLSLLAGFCLLLASCQSRPESAASEKAALDGSQEDASVSGLTGDSAKLITTSSMSLQVAHVDSFVRDAIQLTQALGGTVVRQEITYTPVRHREEPISSDSLLLIEAIAPQATLAVRIPVLQLDSFLFVVTDRSLYPLSRLVETEDASLRYLENTLKLQNRDKTVSEAPAAVKNTSLRDRIALRDEAITHDLDNRSINAEVRYSLLNLTLTQNPVVRRTTVANLAIDDYRLPVSARLSGAFSSGFRYFGDFLFGVLHLWLFIVVGIAGFLVLRHFRRTRKAPFPALKS